MNFEYSKRIHNIKYIIGVERVLRIRIRYYDYFARIPSLNGRISSLRKRRCIGIDIP